MDFKIISELTMLTKTPLERSDGFSFTPISKRALGVYRLGRRIWIFAWLIGLLLQTSAVASSVTLQWTAPGDDSLNGQAQAYDLRYSTSAITGLNWNQATQAIGEPVPGAAGSAQECTIDGLVAGTLYYFALKTRDEANNWSALSNVATWITIILDTDDEEGNIPSRFELLQNYPNPFNPSTTISYSLARPSHVKIAVFNLAGQVTSSLADSYQIAGFHTVVWNGTDDRGRELASGIYFYRIIAGSFVDCKKMLLVK